MAAPHPTLVTWFDYLEGPRITIRPYAPDDAPALQAAIAESRDFIRPWLPFADHHQTVDESREWINRCRAEWILRTNANCGLWLKDVDRYLGGIGLHIRNQSIGYYEIGYWLRASVAGQGYMTEAVTLLTDFAFGSLQANRVEIRADANNTASTNVARRAGFIYEGTLRKREPGNDGALRDMAYFSLTPDDRRGAS